MSETPVPTTPPAGVTADQQAMWDALAILGIDTDGDHPGAVIAGMGADGYRVMFLSDVAQIRREHDEAVDEVCMNPAAHTSLPESLPESTPESLKGGCTHVYPDGTSCTLTDHTPAGVAETHGVPR